MKFSSLTSASTDSLPELIDFDEFCRNGETSRPTQDVPRRCPGPAPHPASYITRIGQTCAFDCAFRFNPNPNPAFVANTAVPWDLYRPSGIAAAMDEFYKLCRAERQSKPKPAPKTVLVRARL
ncbi:hypothetical protein EXIGLDRAFT_781645 [Exidia glandulosa HHB12029]|uniref:Uncharacterized protein n=1 Tax=Exidia glandulosa HHB12029 TaxID=1314781 RepID=A0A165B6F8_EXIGL|nr:hypothetical protein EXIGLDRAFT_781645 [Exidia glandulosa HHB12029]